LTASIQIGWGPLWSTNDLGLYVYDALGNLRAQSNTINLPGLSGKREHVAINLPSAGSWRIVVRNTLGLAVTSQPFVGVLELARAQYSVSDLGTVSPAQSDEIQQNLRTFTMFPIGSRFRPDFIVSRYDFAVSLVLGARVPQYLSGQQTYSDVREDSSRLFVESVQASPDGAVFIDVTPGGRFRPNDATTRLAAAVGLVRAAGLRSEAEARAGTPLTFLDAASIPAELRGYVSVAVSRGLLQANTLFRPQSGLTRVELAHAMAVIEAQAIQ
jgi:hypothetical protein